MAEDQNKTSYTGAEWSVELLRNIKCGNMDSFTNLINDLQNKEEKYTFDQIIGEALWQAIQAEDISSVKELADIVNTKCSDCINFEDQLPRLAVKAGNVDHLQVLLDVAKIYWCSPDHNASAVWQAAMDGRLDMLRLLLPDNLDPEVTAGIMYELDIDDAFMAILVDKQPGEVELVEFLIDKGADLNPPDWDYPRPLQKAIKNSDWEMAELLVRKGANIFHCGEKGLPFFMAVEKGNKEFAMRVLLPSDINMQDTVEDEYNPETCGYTMLMHACKSGDMQLVKMLVEEYNADVSIHAKGTHCLQIAYRHFFIDMMEYLLTHINIKAFLPGGLTPFQWMIQKGRETPDLLQHYLKQGVDPNMPINGDQTPLMHVASHHDAENLKLLLEYNADPNVVSRNNQTALWCSITRGYNDCAMLILKSNPDVRLSNLQVQFGQVKLNTVQKALHYRNLSILTHLAGAGCSLYNIADDVEAVKDMLSERLYEELLAQSIRPLSLYMGCKVTIKNCLGHIDVDEKIKQLPLPVEVQDFLSSAYIDPVFTQ